MNSEGKQGREESFTSLGRVFVQESGDNTISPTLVSDNMELGTEALTRVVIEVLETVFEAKIRGTNETLQASVRMGLLV
ncbi:hypothetical protein J1N35_030256 [Gossypium stocksii]|uniref:Uncharacterized protein n=1 Tax=Gossypium stocksii TaxID=47602 RepID=A0A9D3V1K3_9ROSI|nr:hypothetical protein J1N35_030256 [Gossypium stocksii]